jgi:hypothetical protein
VLLLLVVGLAFGAGPHGPLPVGGGVGAGAADGVGGAVVLPGQPDDRVAVVLPAGGDRDAGTERQGGLAVADGLAAEGVAVSAGTPKPGLSRSKASSAALKQNKE